jgi:hypothetical protein
MNDLLFLSDLRNKNQFRIHYPYLGLFSSAEVTPIDNDAEVLYKCELLNGSILYLKKLIQHKKWIDANLNIETPLSTVIGISIDDFLNTSSK